MFGDCAYPAMVAVRVLPEFVSLLAADRRLWRRCFLWSGWLPPLSLLPAESWAASSADVALHRVEAASGSYTEDCMDDWGCPLDHDVEEAAALMLDSLNVWTDGSLARDPLTALCALLQLISTLVFAGSLGFMRGWGRVRSFLLVLTVQRDELWSATLALQAWIPVYVGIDNVTVVRQLGELIDDRIGGVPLQWLAGGELLDFIRSILHVWGLGTNRVAKVKGHAADEIAREGQVRAVEQVDNQHADGAAELRRRTVPKSAIDARRWHFAAASYCCRIVEDLHRFFVAICRVMVNEDGTVGVSGGVLRYLLHLWSFLRRCLIPVSL